MRTPREGMDVLELTASLISFKTEAPPGNEAKCAGFIADYLSRPSDPDGADLYLHGFAEDRANL